MVRALAVSVITAIVFLFTAAGNTQPIGSNQFGEGSEAISWEMYRQRQVEMQLEIQRQQLEIQRQRLELQQQQLEIQRQQHQLELEKQRIERQKKQME
jgi:3-hydroxy-3-methylglutaryl CoA synthase